MKLSIIIVNWKVKAMLRDCLRSVLDEMLLSPDNFEVIVIDNDSRDGSVEMVTADFPSVRLIASDRNLGFADGCQAGYEMSAGEFVLLLNPDTVILDHAVDRMLETIEAIPDAAIVGSRLRNTDGSFQRASGGGYPRLGNLAWNYLLLDRIFPKNWAPKDLFLQGDPPGVQDIEWVSGASLLFRRMAVGPRIFDPAFFMFGEDMDLCDRMRRAGWRVLYSAEQSIVHHHGSSFAKQNELEVLATVYKGPRSFFARNHGPVQLFLYDVILFVGYGLRWFASSALARLGGRAEKADQARFNRQFVSSIIRTRFAPPQRD